MKRRSILKGAVALLLAPLAMFRKTGAAKPEIVSFRPLKRWVGRFNGVLHLNGNHHFSEGRWDQPDCWDPLGVPTKDDDVMVEVLRTSCKVTIEIGSNDCACKTLIFGDHRGEISFVGDGEIVVSGQVWPHPHVVEIGWC